MLKEQDCQVIRTAWSKYRITECSPRQFIALLLFPVKNGSSLGKVSWTRGEWEGSGCALKLCLSRSHCTSGSHQAQTILLGAEHLPSRWHSCCGKHLLTAVRRALEGMFPEAIIWSKTGLGFSLASVRQKVSCEDFTIWGHCLSPEEENAKSHGSGLRNLESQPQPSWQLEKYTNGLRKSSAF